MKIKPLPPLERLRELFFYPPPTGELYYKNPNGLRFKSLDRAGTLGARGYLRLAIDKKNYAYHRIFYSLRHNVELPADVLIDHVNGNKSDNHIDNLRITTPSQNSCNRGKPINNTSGYRGVCWDKAAKKWRADISVNRRRKFLGHFHTKEEGALAFNAAALKYHGEFAQLNEVPKV